MRRASGPLRRTTAPGPRTRGRTAEGNDGVVEGHPRELYRPHALRPGLDGVAGTAGPYFAMKHQVARGPGHVAKVKEFVRARGCPGMSTGHSHNSMTAPECIEGGPGDRPRGCPDQTRRPPEVPDAGHRQPPPSLDTGRPMTAWGGFGIAHRAAIPAAGERPLADQHHPAEPARAGAGRRSPSRSRRSAGRSRSCRSSGTAGVRPRGSWQGVVRGPLAEYRTTTQQAEQHPVDPLDRVAAGDAEQETGVMTIPARGEEEVGGPTTRGRVAGSKPTPFTGGSGGERSGGAGPVPRSGGSGLQYGFLPGPDRKDQRNMWPSLVPKVARYRELEHLLVDPAVVTDSARYGVLAKETGGPRQGRPAVPGVRTNSARPSPSRRPWSRAEADPGDCGPYAQEEVDALKRKQEELEDPRRGPAARRPGRGLRQIDRRNPGRDRRGRGGPVSPATCTRLYTRYARNPGGGGSRAWSSAPARPAGSRRSCSGCPGEGVYRQLKYESGGHRVQRVPKTETQGRIHTSAATVAVLPETGRGGRSSSSRKTLVVETMRAGGGGAASHVKQDGERGPPLVQAGDARTRSR